MTSFRQLSFSSGEITPAVWGRVDQSKHGSGLKLCENFTVMRHGGVQNRPGTRFVGEVSDSTKSVRLIPFIFNSSQTYILEFGDTYMRVILNGIHVKDITKTISFATKANPCVITTSTSHGLSNGDEVYITDVEGMIELNVRNFKVAAVTGSTFELRLMDGSTNLNSIGFGTYSGAGTMESIFEITTPYQEADLPDLYYAQSADVVELVHPSHAPRELARTGHASWALTTTVFGPTIGTPQNLLSDSAGSGFNYKVTAISDTTGEESLPSTLEASTTKTSTLSWDAVSGASTYNIFREIQGLYSWIGVAGTNSFLDADLTPDPLDNPPEERLPFATSNNYPSVVAFYQQRAFYANTNNAPETVWTSKTGLRHNMMISTPLQANDAVTFTLAGVQVNSIRHIVGLSQLIMFTDSGEWVITGDVANIITPTDVSPVEHTRNGSSNVKPLVVQGTSLYIQARGSVVRDLNYDFETAGYRGNEISIFSAHLFDNFTMNDWTYQQIPDSIVWLARSDGRVLGMTYLREHAVFGWHQHDFGGTVENLAVIPAGNSDRLFVVVKRTINGKVVRFIEFLETRLIDDIRDMVFMDSTLSYDGRNTGAGTITLTTGTTWTHDDTITITSSTSIFDANDIDNQIWLYNSDESEIIRITIKAFTSDTVVTGTPHKDVQTEFQGVASTNWSLAVGSVSGLWHIEGEDVSIFADANVAANPLNDAYEIVTIVNGIATLDIPAAVIHVGLPVTARIQTLDIDASDAILADKAKHLSVVTLQVESSRGIFAGIELDDLKEFKLRDDEDYDSPPSLETGNIEVNISGDWNNSGSIYVQQIDPVPVAILSAVPSGYIVSKESKK